MPLYIQAILKAQGPKVVLGQCSREIAPGLVAVLEFLGLHGRLELFELLPFRPYLEIVLWTALASIYSSPLTTLFRAKMGSRR